MNKPNLIIDFDSTFVKLEALDELAAIALSGRQDKEKITKEIRKITQLGMEGKITFPESLSRRFKLLPANRDHIEKLTRLLKKNVSDSIKQNKKFFQKNHKKIYIISGGFQEYICPVVEIYGIKPKNVLANKFIFDKKGNVCGFDRKRNLCQENGKIKEVKKLKLRGETWVLGDGYTDFQIREAKLAKKFVVYCENVKRKSVCRKADGIANNFNEFLKMVNGGI